MIKISNKQDCCACTACAERCTRSCIKMQPDSEGFLYPEVDESACIHCNLCNTVCPILNQKAPVPPIAVYAAKHKNDQILKRSSSGGIFTALAETVIREGGVVFGARFDKQWKVIHSYTDTIEGLAVFRGSKYVQSSIGNSYSDAEQFLKGGRKVLFSGTPCQIAGLKSFLRKEYDNLLTVDIICHGVPSPLVWSKYVETLHPKVTNGGKTISSLKRKPVITSLSFRDKRAGWRKYGFSVWQGEIKGNDGDAYFLPNHSKRVRYEIQQQNIFLRGFFQNLYLRPSCHHCQFRNFKSGSDMTIADYWGVRHLFPDMDDDKGLSLVILKTKAIPMYFFENLNMTIIRFEDYEKAFKGNSALINDAKPSRYRLNFWDEMQNADLSVIDVIKRNTIYSRKNSIRNNLDLLLLNVGLYNSIKQIVRLLRKL